MVREIIKGRFFLVGCPRSGTTLLQSLIVAHSQIASFPESKFFQKIIVSQSIYEKFNLAPFTARRVFNSFLEDIDSPELKRLLPLNAIFVPQYVNSFIKVLDTVTLQQQKTYWLEKPLNISEELMRSKNWWMELSLFTSSVMEWMWLLHSMK